MSLQQRIRDWLGLSGLKITTNAIIWRLDDVQCRLLNIENATRNTELAIDRILAKLDPTFAQSEFDLARKAASDKLAEDIINRLHAEDHARRHTTGDL